MLDNPMLKYSFGSPTAKGFQLIPLTHPFLYNLATAILLPSEEAPCFSYFTFQRQFKV